MSAQRTVVGAVIVDDKRRVLAARRTSPRELAGLWEFPGGKVEPAESPQSALVREIREELSATITVGQEIADGEAAWPISSALELRLFASVLADGHLTVGDSHDQLCWLGSDELELVAWLPSDRAALDAVKRLLESQR